MPPADPPDLAAGKRAWRTWAARLPVAADEVPAVCAAVAAFLAGLDLAPVVATYSALPDEVDLAALRLPAGATAVLPRLDDDGSVSWRVIGRDGETERHRFGIVQPTPAARVVAPGELDVVLVPGRVFDRRGYRLGRGGGHYDRLLPELRPEVPTVGVTTRARLVARVPVEAHDVPMTHLATEDGVRAVH